MPDNPFAEFKPEIRDAVEGLLWLGYLEDDFDFCGHRFSIRTLKGDEELLVAMLTREYMETLGQAKAWAWAHIALALTAIDGKTDFCPPIGPDKAEHARGRFQYVTSRWYWPLAEYIWTRFALLQQRQVTAVKAVQDLSQRSLHPSSPSPDSLTEQGTSQIQTDSPESTTT